MTKAENLSSKFNLKVALVQDWLTGMRGGEKVLEVLCRLFPNGELFTLLHNPGSVSSIIESRRIHTSFINKLPFKEDKYRNYLPLFPTAIERFNFRGFDLILSTSHAVAKGIITPPGSLHISYLHTPMRYVWDMYDDYFGKDRANWLSRKLIPFFANYLRIWDVTSSNRVDWFLANSAHVAKRIRKYYRREAQVIHPPVNTGLFSPDKENDGYYLVVSALVSYKRIDLAVSACNRLQKKLIVVGSGPELQKLKNLAGSTIQFIDWQPPESLKKYYQRCKALLFPGEEDFGIVPVEAMGCGKPVIAYGKGGALETVVGKNDRSAAKPTGIFFPEQTVESLIQSIKQNEEMEWDCQFIANHAKKFDVKYFRENISRFISEKVESFFSRP